MSNNQTAYFYQLLRLSLGLTQEFLNDLDTEMWRWLYHTAVRQSVTGICYEGICMLPNEKKPPVEIAMQWLCEAETTRGANELQYQEVARLTRTFAEKGRKTVILKGQANARLYPNKFSRQPGDVDLWIEGGRESVISLLMEMDLLDSLSNTSVEGGATATYHHVHLPKNEHGVIVEIHFRPSSGNYAPLTNRRLQRWLEQEIQHTTAVPEGFNVPSVRFALVMQLAHIQRHFLSSGIGLRQIVDYYWLLQEATADDLRQVEQLLDKFGLRHAAGALMWVLGEVLHLEPQKMIGKTDSFRGQWMLRETMEGGNFGHYARRQQYSLFKRVLEDKRRRLRLTRFNFREIFWLEVNYWELILKTLPTRIKYRTLSLRDFPG